MKLTLALGAALTAATTLVACNDIPIVPIGDTVTVIVNERSNQLGSNAVDLLWVIDNSNSMSEEQEELARQFGSFIDEFVQIGADFHLAVITTDVSDEGAGRFQTHPGNSTGNNCLEPAAAVADCPGSLGPVLASDDYRQIPGDPTSPIDSARLRHDFVCLASVGNCGIGYEMGLDALETALDPDMTGRGGVNEGFLREDAFLGIIIVTDEDDCSVSGTRDLRSNSECYREADRANLSPISRFHDAILAAKNGNEDQILISAVMGPPTPGFGEDIRACTGPNGNARDGKRYRELMASFGPPLEGNICTEGFQVTLREIGGVIAASLGYECLGDTRIPSCVDDRDCSAGVACHGPYGHTAGPYLCDNYEVFLEVGAGNAPFVSLNSPGAIGNIAVDGGGVLSTEALPDGADYALFYGDNRCTSNVSFSFSAEAQPSAGSFYRVSYPIEVSLEGSGGNVEEAQ